MNITVTNHEGPRRIDKPKTNCEFARTSSNIEYTIRVSSHHPTAILLVAPREF